MTESDLTTLLREHRIFTFIGRPDLMGYDCTCGQWQSKLPRLEAHGEWCAHVASVLSGVYAITPLPEPPVDRPHLIRWMHRNSWTNIGSGLVGEMWRHESGVTAGVPYRLTAENEPGVVDRVSRPGGHDDLDAFRRAISMQETTP